MEMKIIPANGGGPGMDGVFLSGYGDGDYTPRPHSSPLPSLVTHLHLSHRVTRLLIKSYLIMLNDQIYVDPYNPFNKRVIFVLIHITQI